MNFFEWNFWLVSIPIRALILFQFVDAVILEQNITWTLTVLENSGLSLRVYFQRHFVQTHETLWCFSDKIKKQILDLIKNNI